MKNKKALILDIIVFFTAAIAAFSITRLIMSGVTPTGQLVLDDSLTVEQQRLITKALDGHTFSGDLTVSSQILDTLSTAPGTLTYDVLVPVAPFDYAASSTTLAELQQDDELQLISIRELTPEQKLLALEGNYYFDSFATGGQFITLNFSGDDANTAVDLVAAQLETLPNKSNTLSFAQTGVTALSRGLDAQLAVVGDGAYFAANLADFLASRDLTHISNEVSFADDCTAAISSTVLCADWRMLDTITAIGTDIVELTGNHNNDYGTAANLETIEKYHELGLQTFGGGEDEEAAARPLQISQKDANITLLGYNYSTTTTAYGGATGDIPGANLYDEDTAMADIAAAKERGDFVIVDVQFFECYAYPEDGGEYPYCDAPISGSYQGVPYDQTEFFRHLVDLGADMVVGTSAHQPQTYELYYGKPIYYGLGNLFFDQIYWPGTTRGLILTHYFVGGKYVQTRLTPTVYDETYQTTLMQEEDATWLLNRLNQAKP